MQFFRTILLSGFFCVNLKDHGYHVIDQEKVQAWESDCKTSLVAASHKPTEVLGAYASVDSAHFATAPFERSSFHTEHSSRNYQNGSAKQELGMALSLVQSHERKTCTMLSSMWWHMVRSGRRVCRRWSDLCPLGSEPSQNLCPLGYEAAAEITEKGQRQRPDTQSQAKKQSTAKRQETSSRNSNSGGTPAIDIAKHEQWHVVLDDHDADATGSQSGCTSRSTSIARSASVATCRPDDAAAISSNETAAELSQERPRQVISGEPRACQESYRQRGERRREGASTGSKGIGQSSSRSTRGDGGSDKFASPVAQIFVNERFSMAELHHGVSAAGTVIPADHSACQRSTESSQAEFGCLKRSLPFAQAGDRGTRSHVGGGCTGRIRSTEIARGIAKPEFFATEPPQGCRGCLRRGTAAIQESQSRRRHRRLIPTWWASIAAFSWARHVTTVVCECQGQVPEWMAPEVFRMKWRHGVLEERAFRTEWHARAAATRLSFECGTVDANITTSLGRRTRVTQNKHRQISFAETFSLFCIDPAQHLCISYQGRHGQVQDFIHNFHDRLVQDVDPLSSQLRPAVLISLDDTDDDNTNLMHLQTRHFRPFKHNDPETPPWYPIGERGEPPQPPQDDDESFEEEQDSANSGDSDEQIDEPDDRPRAISIHQRRMLKDSQPSCITWRTRQFMPCFFGLTMLGS